MFNLSKISQQLNIERATSTPTTPPKEQMTQVQSNNGGFAGGVPISGGQQNQNNQNAQVPQTDTLEKVLQNVVNICKNPNSINSDEIANATDKIEAAGRELQEATNQSINAEVVGLINKEDSQLLPGLIEGLFNANTTSNALVNKNNSSSILLS